MKPTAEAAGEGCGPEPFQNREAERKCERSRVRATPTGAGRMPWASRAQ